MSGSDVLSVPGGGWGRAGEERVPDPGIEPRCPALEADALTSEPPGKPQESGWGN